MTRPKSERHLYDFYQTPPALAAVALALVPESFTPRVILDPGAGAGVWGDAARRRWPDAVLVGCEIRETPRPPAYDRWVVADVLEADLPATDLVLGNPPYSLAEPVLRRVLALVRPGGLALALLRLSFHASAGRRAFWATWPPATVATVRPRPSFTSGGTDSAEYGVFTWRQGHTGPATLAHLDWAKR